MNLAKIEPSSLEIAKPATTSLDILEAAVRGGVTSENVAVVKEIIAMRRDEMREQAKADFARAFFQLKKDIASLTIYADKAAQHNGKTAYTYCSEGEISEKLEPLLFRHGFAMMFSQRRDEGCMVAIITLMHESGHQEVGEYSVRTGNTNAMKDATAVDSGATTSAWRHLVIKMFGLKSRISEFDDARNLGSAIAPDLAGELERRVAECNADRARFLAFAGAKSFAEIPSAKYGELDRFLQKKEGRA